METHRFFFEVARDLAVTARERQPGPPKRIDGMTLGIVHMSEDAPHGGELHPDGDEVLYVVDGRLRVTGDSEPEGGVEIGPGEACSVPRGQWHRVEVLEPTSR